MARSLFLVWLLLLLAAGACSPGGDSVDAGIACPDERPDACPSPEPSYNAEVAPILVGHCAPCHFAGGVEDSRLDLSTFTSVFINRASVAGRINSCSMPPTAGVPEAGVEAGAPPLSAEQRSTVLQWVACGAPNN